MKKKGLAMLLVAAMTLSMGSSVYAADKADDQKELSITVSGVNKWFRKLYTYICSYGTGLLR